MRLGPLLSLSAALALGLLPACCSTDPAWLALVQDEIATVGSEAKTPGPRSPDQVARIASQVATLQAHFAARAR